MAVTSSFGDDKGVPEMETRVRKNGYVIPQEKRDLVSMRYKTITRAINTSLWGISSDTAHSFYVGSYGRGTAVVGSDLDILAEVPDTYHVWSAASTYNPQSRLLQVVRQAVMQTYSRSEVKGDGQVVVINFSDGMKFEILPAFPRYGRYGDVTYDYPDTHMGGRWLSTNPKAEQNAMSEKNRASNGLLFDTCKHMRTLRNECFPNDTLSGIVIDSFVYLAIGNWRWTNPGEGGSAAGEYESALLKHYNESTWNGHVAMTLRAPGSGVPVETSKSLECLGKVLHMMAG